MEKIFFINDVITLMTAEDWEQYKANMPKLASDHPAPELQNKVEYEGGTRYFEELKDEHLQGAISFLLNETMRLDEELLGELLADEIEEQLDYMRKHEKLFYSYEDFAVGKLHRIHCFHIRPEPTTVTALLGNDIRAQALRQIEEMLNEDRLVRVNNIHINESLNDYIQMIQDWYATFNGLKDYCEDMGFEFGYEDGVPLG